MRQFKGEIAGKRLGDFNKYDNTLTKYEDRVKLVEESLYDGSFVHDFFATYFDTYYTVSPNQTGYLAEEDAVCKLIEILGTYILNANDVQSNRKIEYRFWKSEREYRDYKDSQNVGAITTDDSGREVEVVDMFVDKKAKNQKIVRPYSITSKDNKEISEIGQLTNAIDFMKSPAGIKSIKERVKSLLEDGVGSKEEQDKLTYILKNTERYVNAYAKDLRDAQLLIKKAIKRPIEFKAIMKGEGALDKLDAIDFMEEKDIRSLLPFLSEEDMMSDIGMIIHDLKELLKKSKLSDGESRVVALYEEGMRPSEIAEELNITKQSVKKMECRIAKKVVKTYEKQVEDYREQVRQKKVK